MDEDVAYFIGLLTAKGKLIEEKDNRRIIIDFPYRNLFTRAPEESGIKYSVPDKIKIGLFDIQKNLHELLGEEVSMEETEGSISFIVKFSRNTMVWRNITTIMQDKINFYEFELNPIFYEMPESIQKCFMQGFADASSMPSEKDQDQFKRNRIVLQIPHDNWKLPVQICKLLQIHLKIPVCHIMYGHPSLKRDFREHRMRIFPEDFIKIGYGFSFKQDILKAFINPKKNIKRDPSSLCNPKAKRIPKKKDKDPKEKDEKLPEHVRRHFNAYWQICMACGCKQGKKKPQLDLSFIAGDEIDE
ncbi:hypothetical protein ISS30_05690 [bacterium]|nr:hypothetical protein [bacterium]